MRAPSGSTRVAAVIGDPIAHSRSPAIHNAAFAALDLDWVFVALPTPTGRAADAIAGARALGIDALSVTMPHKEAVIASLDEVTHSAAALRSVNCISRVGDRLVGDSTDGAGFLAGLATDFGFDPAGRRCVVLGAGGAARAVVLALAGAGAASVGVLNRTQSRAAQAAALAGPVGSVVDAAALPEADLIVNATSIGMRTSADAGAEPMQAALPLDPTALRDGQVVAELIYHPARTALMQAAEQAGCATSNGLSMLVHQAAVAFETWTGHDAPIEVMAAAATA